MAVIPMPSFTYFETAQLKLSRSGLSMRSRYTARRQAIVFPFAIWVFDGSTIKMSSSEAAGWRSFLTQLEGTTNTFRLPVPGTESGPLSAFSGTAAVGTGGAAVGAKAMPITTTGGTTPFLKAGDYFTVNDELKVCTADCATGTNVTLNFEPFLRGAVTLGMALTVTNPTILMCAADFEQADWSIEPPVLHTVKLKAVEAF